MYILTCLRGQVNQFSSFQFFLEGKIGEFDVIVEGFQTLHTLHADPQAERARGEDTAIGNPHIQGINKIPKRFSSSSFQLPSRDIILPLQMESVSLGDLA